MNPIFYNIMITAVILAICVFLICVCLTITAILEEDEKDD